MVQFYQGSTTHLIGFSAVFFWRPISLPARRIGDASPDSSAIPVQVDHAVAVDLPGIHAHSSRIEHLRRPFFVLQVVLAPTCFHSSSSRCWQLLYQEWSQMRLNIKMQ